MLTYIECRYKSTVDHCLKGCLISRTVIDSSILADFLLYQARTNPTVSFNTVDFSNMNQYRVVATKLSHKQEWIRAGDRFKLIQYSH